MGFVERGQFAWKLRTRAVQLGERTRVMAVVNLTPDSFSGDGMAARGVEACVAAAVAAVDAGADIVDLGAESTRPGAEPVRTYVEQRRLLPVLEGLLRQRPEAVVSVDTYHALTALEAARAGAEIINDVSGLSWDPEMARAVAETRCGLVLMHTRGRPQEWRGQERLAADAVVQVVLDGLRAQLAAATGAGIEPESIVVDPGFGFGKIGRENFSLLAGMERLAELGCGVLAGVSRKGFLGEAVKAVQARGGGAGEALWLAHAAGEGRAGADANLAEARRTASIAAQVAAVLAGAHVIRAHDVQQAREAAAVADEVLRAGRIAGRAAAGSGAAAIG
jgi:dihydropteroate synthase